MSSRSDDDPTKRFSTERYSRVAALYAVTVATAMFIMPVIHHLMHYHQFDVEKFLLRLIGIVCVMLAMYLGPGLALDSKLPIQISYGLASLPFIFISLDFLVMAKRSLLMEPNQANLL